MVSPFPPRMLGRQHIRQYNMYRNTFFVLVLAGGRFEFEDDASVKMADEPFLKQKTTSINNKRPLVLFEGEHQGIVPAGNTRK